MIDSASTPTGQPKDDLTGRFLDGRYRVVSVLGRGGMGTVYLARDERMDRQVVVKVPHARFLEEEGFRERFEREVRSLTALEHPGVVKVLDAGHQGGLPYAVLQYLPGGSLRERLRIAGGRESPRQIESWLPPIAAALDYIHGEGIVHRDVKPGNILFDRKANVFLADFGIAKAAGTLDTGLTQTGMTPGSPDYMAPEAAGGASIGPRYDQYALGVVVYEALTGRLPHSGATPIEILVRKQTHAAPSLSEVASHVPVGTAAAVMRALAKLPSDRFVTCAEFAGAFVDGLRDAPGAVRDAVEVARRDRSVDAARADSTAPSIGRRRRTVTLALVGAVLLGAGLFASGVFDARTGGQPRRDATGSAPSVAPPYSKALADASVLMDANDLPAAKSRIVEARALGAAASDIPAALRDAIAAYDAPAEVIWDEPRDGWVSDSGVVRVRGSLAKGRAQDVVRFEGKDLRRGVGPFDVDVSLTGEGEHRTELSVEDGGVSRLVEPLTRRLIVTPRWSATIERATAAASASDWELAKSLVAKARALGATDVGVPTALREGISRYDAPPTVTIDQPLEHAQVLSAEVEVRGHLVSGRAGDVVWVDGKLATLAGGRFSATIHLTDEGPHSIEVTVLEGGAARLPAPIRRPIVFRAPFRDALDAARVAARDGQWMLVRRRVAEAIEKGAQEADVPSSWAERIREYEVVPRLTLAAPASGLVVYDDSVLVRGTIETGRDADRVVVNGVTADRVGSVFTVQVPRSAAVSGKLRAIVMSADEERATAERSIKWSDGRICPAFSVQDMHGRTVSLSSLKGKWFVLDWINFNCHYTKHDYDTRLMQPIQDALASKGVEWLLVSSSPAGKRGYMSIAEWNAALIGRRVESVDVLLDSNQAMERAFEVTSTRRALLVDPSGRIVYDGETNNEMAFVSYSNEGVATINQSPPVQRVNYVQVAFLQALAGGAVANRGKGRGDYG